MLLENPFVALFGGRSDVIFGRSEIISLFDDTHIQNVVVPALKRFRGETICFLETMAHFYDEEPTLDEFVDICSRYDNIRVVGQAHECFLPVENVFPSDSALCTIDGDLGDEVVVFELG